MGATYVIAGGYTVGHLTPGLAVAEGLRAHHPHLEILFAGWADPADAEFVRKAGLSFLALPAAPWSGRGVVTRSQAIAAVLPAAWIARRRFSAAGAVGLLSLGSFAAFAPALAARSLGLPVTVFEPNARFGLANRCLRPLAHQVLASRLLATGGFSRSIRCEVVGVPLRGAVHALSGRTPEPPAGVARVLVLGGSLGDPFLNLRVPGLAGRLAARGLKLQVTHQCGRSLDPTVVRAAYARAGVPAIVEAFLDPVAPALAEAHFVLTAGGAVTLHEIAAAGVPALVVPLSTSAASHQYANAEAFRKATGCLSLTEQGWNEAAAAESIAAVLGDGARWRQLSRSMQAFVVGDARAAAALRIIASLPEYARGI